MAYASSIRGAIAAPANTRFGFGFWRAVTEAVVDSRRRRALRELRRHQAFGPLINIKHIGLTQQDLLPF